MLWRALVCCLVILATTKSLLAHPLTHLVEMSYAGPVKKILLVLYITAESVEEDRDKLDLADSAYLSQETPGFGYPSLFTGEMNRDGLQTAGFSPGQAVKELMLEKPVLNPLSRFFGSRRLYRKRGTNTECFWKYCV
ncbi:prepro-urotensin II-beta [Clupea harengus]|uniref:Prepro-urotensin II-beta n=1 Tax=Clupea harengus TaxID=7950 RepID=A0A8M1KPL9_CLUHA|nr:prepro-urotensin II-beta [Clupea harengus]